jgi:glycosyltransferase involved in cell wall biosynthesis
LLSGILTICRILIAASKKQMRKGISILICSHNGAKNLQLTLEHIARQQIAAELSWEVLLIDNASTDGTAEKAAGIWAKLSVPVSFRIVKEPRPGKNNAIDTGLALAKYAYVLVCDDDNWLSYNYLQIAFDIMESNDQIGILGGQGVPAFETTPPAWFDKYTNYYAVGGQNTESGEIVGAKGFLWGAGSVIRRSAYKKLTHIGFKRILTYERFPDIARGEDIELCLAIRLAGYKLWYDERLVFKHFIGKEKLTWNYLTRLVKEGNIMVPVIGMYKSVLRGLYTHVLPAENAGLKRALTQLSSWSFLSSLIYITFRRNSEGNKEYLKRMEVVCLTRGYVLVGRQYSQFLTGIINLKNKLALDKN